MTVCFHFPTAALTHRQVLDAARRKLQFVKDGQVVNIQVITNIKHFLQITITYKIQRSRFITNIKQFVVIMVYR